MRISNCVARDALIDAIVRTETGHTRQSLLGMVDSVEGQKAILNGLKSKGAKILWGSDCPDHPFDGLTITMPDLPLLEVYRGMLRCRELGVPEKSAQYGAELLKRLKSEKLPAIYSERVVRAEIELTMALNEV